MIALFLLACSSTPQVSEVRGEALGTTWSVKWVGPQRDWVDVAVADALNEVDRGMSTWRQDSEINRIRSNEGPIEVSQGTYEVVVAALEIADKSGGAFDPTVQPLVELWGFHGKRRTTLPSDEELASARALVGYGKVSTLGEQGRWVDGGGTALDLSAIAKGHAVDRVSEAVSELGLSNHLVEVGGEVRAVGVGRNGSGWRLGVDTPEAGLAPGEKLAAVVTLHDRSMATSGNYRNSYTIGSVEIGHTLDPRTGRPAENTVRSATVVAPDCRTADGWATALMVLGAEGLPLIEAEPEVDALLLVEAAEGYTQLQSSQMRRVLSEK